MRSLPILCVLAAAAVPARAQEEAPAGQSPPRRQLALTEDECVELAIRQNHGLAADWLEARIAEAGILQSRGVFDPAFTSEASWAENRIPIGSALGGASVLENSVITWNSGVGGLLPTGLTYQINFNVSNTDTNNSFALFNPQTDNSLNVRLTQPILRGSWTTVNRAGITRSEIQESVAEEDFNASLGTLIHNTRSAYWDLFFAHRNVQLRENNLELGHESVRITRRRYAEGLVPASDILSAMAEVYRREEDLIAAQNALYNAEDALKRLLFPLSAQMEWEFALTPATVPRQPSETTKPNLESSLADAFRFRPDLRSARLEIRQRELDLRVARNGLLPQLDLIGTYGSRALGVTLDDTWRDVLGGLRTSYSVGVSLSVPIGNMSARGQLRAAELRLRQGVERLRDLENQLAAEVRQAVRDLFFYERSWEAAVQSRRNSEEDHRAQRVKLDLGLITQFDLQTVEQNLIETRTTEVQVQANYERAISNLERVTGRAYREGRIQGLVAAGRLGRFADAGSDD